MGYRVCFMVIVALGALAGISADARADSTSLFGDIDCFGTGFVCADGYYGAGDAAAFSTFVGAMTPDGTSPNTDFWALSNDESWAHTLALSGSEDTGTLTFRTYAMSDMRGPYDVYVNGSLVGTTDLINTGEVYTSQQIDTHTFSFSAAILSNGANTVSVSKVGGSGDSWALDYSQLSATTSVPEPGTLALLGIGILGLARGRRRKQARAS